MVIKNSDYDLTYYVKGALAGGICCSLTHGALTPVDVVKTRIQLEPEVYNKGMVGGFKQVIEAEGAGALLTGLAPTAVGYFVQGRLFRQFVFVSMWTALRIRCFLHTAENDLTTEDFSVFFAKLVFLF